MAKIGYARVSTEDQTTDPQIEALGGEGCETIVTEQASGGDRDRPELARLLRSIGRGDILVVVRIDRLARSLAHLLEILETLDQRGAGFRSLADPIDTTSPQGRFSLQILGAVAEFERALIRERTKAGLRAARNRGTELGNPGLRTRSALAIATIQKARDAARDADALTVAEEILPTVKNLRPRMPWVDVARVLDRGGSRRPDGGPWTGAALSRVVRRLARNGYVETQVLERSPPRRNDDLMVIVAMAARSMENPTLANIARQLEDLRVKTPRGRFKWSISSVQLQLEKAVAGGILEDRPLPTDGVQRRRGRPAKSLKRQS
jgi:DNA invertase Pin-like site-specific DNA recombinase